jgi:hypothetical protein
VNLPAEKAYFARFAVPNSVIRFLSWVSHRDLESLTRRTAFHVSSNGSITTPESERKKRLDKMFDDVQKGMARVRELRSSQR